MGVSEAFLNNGTITGFRPSFGAGGIRSPVAYILYAPSDPPAPSFGGILPPFPPVGRRRLRFESPIMGVSEAFLNNGTIIGFRPSFGAGGIRTPGTLLGFNSLAGSPIRPLSHRSKEPFWTTEQGGFEPPEPSQVQRFSRPPPSTARTPLQKGVLNYLKKEGSVKGSVKLLREGCLLDLSVGACLWQTHGARTHELCHRHPWMPIL